MARTPFDELGERMQQALRDSPFQDVEKNLRVVVNGFLERMDLVLREDFELQRALLDKANARLQELEARVAALEAGRDTDPKNS